jgi:hypothetical protein
MTTKPTRERREPRVMLALIALATDLPVPGRIGFIDDILAMSFDRLVDGQAWSAHLGGKTETCAHKGQRYLNEGMINWHGWSVQLNAHEPALTGGQLDADTTARLAALAGENDA